MKNEGSLTIEATLALPIFIFFMMSVINFGQVYKAQAYVDHRLLQAGKMVSFMSYDYENNTATELIGILAKLSPFAPSVEAGWIFRNMIRSDDYSACVDQVFHQLKGSGDWETPDTIMGYYGIDDVTISAKKNDNDLDINAEYDIKLRFRFFGIEKISMKQSVKCGLWS